MNFLPKEKKEEKKKTINENDLNYSKITKQRKSSIGLSVIEKSVNNDTSTRKIGINYLQMKIKNLDIEFNEYKKQSIKEKDDYIQEIKQLKGEIENQKNNNEVKVY